MEFYEKEFIDMKIRLDVMELDGKSFTNPDLPRKNTKQVEKPEPMKQEFEVPKPQTTPRVPNMSFEDSVTHVLKLITSGPMTSRDIEVTLGKSREHVSRLMKKLFEDGFVSRDASARPYSYTITEKGRVRVGSGEADIAYAVSQ
jgi:predicted HTH transcriptional regulator